MLSVAMLYDSRKNITMQQLETLFYLVEERTFSGAARRMYLSQPALTKQVKNLEEVLGSQVINRNSRGLTLTAPGKILYDYAKRILKLREEAREKIDQLGKDEAGEIHIGASTIPATYILPPILSAFRKRYPRIRSHVQNADSAEVIENILGNEGEIGVVGKNPLNQRLYAEPLWQDRLILVAASGHPWQGRKDVGLGEVQREPFITRERGSATREIIEQALKEKGVSSLDRLNISCELGSSEAVKEAVIAGLGVSIISIHAVTRELAAGVVIEIPIVELEFKRSIYLIHRKGFKLSPQHKLFLDYLRSYQLSAGR
ncbi:MAG: selenium metabolism-associated LysR family transcriptional regulator [Smithellaceae bacterium]|nr:selenium metabolism-associated LysR family transcriptional regulator [Smithellaceae bacterium]